jgi:N-acyl-D-aspartate/D-glutamate deacylase
MQSAEYAVKHLFDPAASVITCFRPDKRYEGKTVIEIAGLRNETPAKTLIHLISAAGEFSRKNKQADDEIIEMIAGASMNEADVAKFLAWPNTNFCTDGSDGGHPRGYGSFTRILGKYVRERKVLSLEQAIYKMTGLTAQHCGIKNRGTIAPGQFADLVLFDPLTITDKATIEHPTALSEGILKVWVNGKCVYQQHQSTKEYPGVLITR